MYLSTLAICVAGVGIFGGLMLVAFYLWELLTA